MNDFPSGSINFHFIQEPYGRHDRQAKADRVQTLEIKYVEGTPNISGQ